MHANEKPVIVPSLATAGTFVWTIVLVLAFVAAIALYSAADRYAGAAKALRTKRPTRVETPYLVLNVPASWARYAQDGDDVYMYKSATDALPILFCTAQRDAAFAYRALDKNPSLVQRQLKPTFARLGVCGADDKVSVLATDVVSVDPGVSAVRAICEVGEVEGLSLTFIVDDVSYVFCGLWKAQDRAAGAEIRERLAHIFDRVVIKNPTSRFTRPVVNSAELTTDEHTRVLAQMGSERALWDLFETRAKTESDAVLPAIEHFRKLLTLTSSIHEEKALCASPAFKRYYELLAVRKAKVAEWFLLLDKYRSMGDTPRAIDQAKFIVKRAVLEDESLDRRRASRVLQQLEAAVAAK